MREGEREILSKWQKRVTHTQLYNQSLTERSEQEESTVHHYSRLPPNLRQRECTNTNKKMQILHLTKHTQTMPVVPFTYIKCTVCQPRNKEFVFEEVYEREKQHSWRGQVRQLTRQEGRETL